MSGEVQLTFKALADSGQNITIIVIIMQKYDEHCTN